MSQTTNGPALVPRASKPRRAAVAELPTLLRVRDYRDPTPVASNEEGWPNTAMPEAAVPEADPFDKDAGRGPSKRPSWKAQLAVAALIAVATAWLMIVFNAGNHTPDTEDASSPLLAEGEPVVTEVVSSEASSPSDDLIATTDDSESAQQVRETWMGLEQTEPADDDFVDESEQISTATHLDNNQQPGADEPYIAGNAEVRDNAMLADAEASAEYTAGQPAYDANSTATGPTETSQTVDNSQPQFGPMLQSPNYQAGGYLDQGYQQAPQSDHRARQPQTQATPRSPVSTANLRDVPPSQDPSTATSYPITDPATYWYPPNQMDRNPAPRVANRPRRGSLPGATQREQLNQRYR